MDRDRVKLQNALTEAYKELLRQPQDRFRILNQRLYAEVRDAIADLGGSTSQQVQEHFETCVAMENDEQ